MPPKKEATESTKKNKHGSSPKPTALSNVHSTSKSTSKSTPITKQNHPTGRVSSITSSTRAKTAVTTSKGEVTNSDKKSVKLRTNSAKTEHNEFRMTHVDMAELKGIQERTKELGVHPSVSGDESMPGGKHKAEVNKNLGAESTEPNKIKSKESKVPNTAKNLDKSQTPDNVGQGLEPRPNPEQITGKAPTNESVFGTTAACLANFQINSSQVQHHTNSLASDPATNAKKRKEDKSGREETPSNSNNYDKSKSGAAKPARSDASNSEKCAIINEVDKGNGKTFNNDGIAVDSVLSPSQLPKLDPSVERKSDATDTVQTAAKDQTWSTPSKHGAKNAGDTELGSHHKSEVRCFSAPTGTGRDKAPKDDTKDRPSTALPVGLRTTQVISKVVKEKDDRISELEKEVEEMKKEKEALEKKNESLTDGLSSQMNNALSQNETDLENINMKVRPMTIADDYKMFCSQAWLDACDALGDDDEEANYMLLCEVMLIGERKAVHMRTNVLDKLADTLNDTFKEPLLSIASPEAASSNSETPKSESQLSMNKKLGRHCDAITGSLLDSVTQAERTNCADCSVEPLALSIATEVKTTFPNVNTTLIEAYIRETARLTWKMAVQRPAMRFSTPSVREIWNDNLGLEPYFGSDLKGKEPRVAYYVSPILCHGEKVMVTGKVMVK